MWAKYYNSLYGLSHFEFSFTCKGKIPHWYKGLYHYNYTANYLWFHCRAEQCMIAYPFMSGSLVFLFKLIIIFTSKIFHTNILNPFHILTSNLLLHLGQGPSLLSAYTFSSVLSWSSPLFPGSYDFPLFWIIQDLLKHFFMLSMKSFQQANCLWIGEDVFILLSHRTDIALQDIKFPVENYIP